MKQTLIYGIHPVNACLQKHPDRILSLMVADSRADKRLTETMALARSQGIAVEVVEKETLTRKADSAQHQGVIANCRHLGLLDEHAIPELLENCQQAPFVLVLDNIQDPHNLGACLRSANAAGVDFVIITKDKSAGITAVVRKVASGAAELTTIVQVTNLARAMKTLQQAGVWIYGLAGEADASIHQTDLRGAVAVVMGAEGTGLRRLTRDHCDGLMSIPMAGEVESLNVSVATGISVFEVLRQRTQ